jgi:hypothetical protein
MEAEGGEAITLIVGQVDEHERFQDLAQVSRAHQPRDVAVAVTTSAVDHSAGGVCWSAMAAGMMGVENELGRETASATSTRSIPM